MQLDDPAFINTGVLDISNRLIIPAGRACTSRFRCRSPGVFGLVRLWLLLCPSLELLLLFGNLL